MDIPPAALPLVPPLAAREVREDELTEKPAEDEEVQEEPPDTTITPRASSSSRSEKRTEAQEATSHDEVINREANSQVHMPMEIEDSYLLNTVNTLLSDESGVETNPWTDDSRQTNS